MKKIIITLVALFVLGGSASAQWNMGARINEGWGLGAEFSLQRILSDANRIELDLGLTWGAGPEHHWMYTTTSGTYQWTFPIVAGLQWFIGLGAQVGLYHHVYEPNSDFNETHVSLAAVAQGGIEYNFDFPLQLAIDARPGVDLLGFGHKNDAVHGAVIRPWVYSFAFSVRYRF